MLRIASNGLGDKPEASALFQKMRKIALNDPSIHGFIAPVFGIVTLLFGIKGDQARKLYLYVCSRDIISAAIRLSIIGPMAAVSVQSKSQAYIDSCLAQYSIKEYTDAYMTFPVGDLFHGLHDSLFRRLFHTWLNKMECTVTVKKVWSYYLCIDRYSWGWCYLQVFVQVENTF